MDRYAAVAAVMHRGRPWQVGVIKLLARGHLPAKEDPLAALRGLPRPGEDVMDALVVARALMQIRIEDLGGGAAIAELAGQAMKQRGGRAGDR